ncbi:hypothetical protein CsSME_00002528 [Camellia sinensis var. sinensis]
MSKWSLDPVSLFILQYGPKIEQQKVHGFFHNCTKDPRRKNGVHTMPARARGCAVWTTRHCHNIALGCWALVALPWNQARHVARHDPLDRLTMTH